MQVAPPSTMKPSQMPAAKNSSNSRGPNWTSFSCACSIAFLMFLKSSSAANRTAAVTTMPMSRRGTISARPAPIRLPSVVGTAIRKASRHGIALRLAKSRAPEAAPTSTGRRLVALAVAASRPRKIMIGSVTTEPDDAAVLRKPQAKPAPRASSRSTAS